jgi:hypothetical protein
MLAAIHVADNIAGCWHVHSHFVLVWFCVFHCSPMLLRTGHFRDRIPVGWGLLYSSRPPLGPTQLFVKWLPCLFTRGKAAGSSSRAHFTSTSALCYLNLVAVSITLRKLHFLNFLFSDPPPPPHTHTQRQGLVYICWSNVCFLYCDTNITLVCQYSRLCFWARIDVVFLTAVFEKFLWCSGMKPRVALHRHRISLSFARLLKPP